MASSFSSLPLQYTYEVFLSFRGDDTRYTFTDHLHAALNRRGINTFRDDKLNRGEDISQELLKAIEESRVFIIVFSPNYASSRWCLDELVHILECRRSKGQAVRSVFYKVDPSDVRKQTGAFGESFAKLDQCKYEDKIQEWRTALKEAADLSGWPVKDDEYEAKFINDIVDELSARVVNPSWHVAKHPVGVESCTEDVKKLLVLEENVIRMVGIWGAGGIGKTTIAKDVFNSIRHKFEGTCFLADVRSNSNGLAQLQEQLLSNVLGDSTLKVSHVDQGVDLIMTRMQRKRALIILDDVSHSSQLEKLVPSHDCFGRGSRILITTRDRGCLRDVDQVYEVKTLNDCQAMNLFSLNAFKTIGPPRDHLELAQHAIRYAQGPPLALIVLGSHLYRRSRDVWEETIVKCRGRGVPHMDIQDILRLSYDALVEDLKEAFLDIACFFKNEEVKRVKQILQVCYGLNSAIEQLQEKALLRIDQHDDEYEIWMHDLIEEMGIQIANPKDKPDKSTRLWRYDDVKRALSNHIGTKKIKGIHLEFYEEDEICLNAKSFSNMKNLRYLSITTLQNIRLWDGCKNLLNLKYMDLSNCYFLEELPDLSGIPNLIGLSLRDCEWLVEIPHSIGSLEKLEILDLRRCYSLVEIPHSIGSLEKLEILNLKWCKGLQEFPKYIGKLDSLRELNLSWTGDNWGKQKGIKQVWVECCQNLTNLEILDLRGCPELVRFLREAIISPDDDSGSLVRFPKLREFDISRCHLSTADFIGDLNCLETLNNLDLSFNKFVTLPALGKFANLESLSLHSCHRLREIPELPPNILRVDARRCESLERFSMLPKYSLNTVEIDLSECGRFSQCLGNDMKMMEDILLNNQDSPFSLHFPGYEVPKWFHYCSKEIIATERGCPTTIRCAVSFEIPSKLDMDNIVGVAVCSVFPDLYFDIDIRADLSINGVHIHQYSGKAELRESYRWVEMWVGYTPLCSEIKGKLLGQGPYQCRVEFQGREIKSCGVHFVCQPPYENSNKMVMVDEPSSENGKHAERKRPHTGANDDYHHQIDQQEQAIVMSPSKRHRTKDELSMAPIDDTTPDQIFQTFDEQPNHDPFSDWIHWPH